MRTRSGQVAIITGGSRGIGKAISRQLAAEGATVVVNYFSDEGAAQETVQEILKQGGQAYALKGAVENERDVMQVVDKTLSQSGKIDILVNNAGILRDGVLFSLKEADWRRVIDVNLQGVLNFTRAVLKPMLKCKFGRIVNLGSVSGLMGTPGQSNYATAKAALIGFTRSLALEVASHGITINTLAAGYVETSMLKSLPPAKLQKYQSTVPQQRFATTDEIAQGISYLTSPEASYINGQVLTIDGGVTLN